METIKDLFRHKGQRPLFSVRPQDTVAKALEIMLKNDLGAIVVMENDRLVGIFSERDLTRKPVLRDHPPEVTPISKFIKNQVVSVSPDHKLEDCLALMDSENLDHLPVLENDKVVAIIDIQQISGTVIKDQEFMINQLTKYITGAYL